MTKISVIILSYNTKKLTNQCLLSLIKNLKTSKDLKTEIILVDNASSDGSLESFKEIQSRYTGQNIRMKIIQNKKNVGYPKGNNQGLRQATGEYILFLNSDVIVNGVRFDRILSFLDRNQETAVLTVKVMLPTGVIDPASHRGFPTIWNSFCYFSKLESIFSSIPLLNNLFGGYHLTYLDLSKPHVIDSPSGAFYLTRKKILKKVVGFDEDFIMYGEDLDLSFRIKKLGFKTVYYPLYTVLHLKHASGLESNDESTREKTKHHFYEAMKIFYKKHYESSHKRLVNIVVYSLIDLMKRFYG